MARTEGYLEFRTFFFLISSTLPRGKGKKKNKTPQANKHKRVPHQHKNLKQGIGHWMNKLAFASIEKRLLLSRSIRMMI